MTNTAQDWTPANVHVLPSASQKNDNDEVDLTHLFSLFWYRKWWILLAMLAAMALGVAYVQQLTPLYSAEAKLILKSEEQNVAGLDSLVPGISDEDAEMNSQIEVIKSRHLIGQVVDRLSLVEDPEYVPSLRDPSLGRQAFRWVLTTVGLRSESEEPNAEKMKKKAVDRLTENLRVSVLDNTHVFKISLQTEDPEKSKLIVNTLADAFVSDQITTKLDSTAQAADWLGAKVNELGETLSEAEARAANFRSQTERTVTELDLAKSNLNLKNARGRLESFVANLERATGSKVPSTDADLARMNVLLRDISELEAIVVKQTQDALTIRQYDREAQAAAKIYEHFATRLNEVEVQKGLQESDVRILSAAVTREEATSPRKKRIVALFGILALILSIAYIVIRKFMDRSFNDPSELQRAFGIPVVGAISQAPKTSRRAVLQYVVKRPSSAIMESIRDLRTSLMITESNGPSDPAEPATVVVFTSSIPGEGKTTCSVLLAVNSAALNKRVLLVECDLRRSTFQTYFGKRTEYGLVNAIQQDEHWEDAIWTDPKTNMDVIFGGISKNRNAGDVFASREFVSFVERMKANYDLIILDSPPVLPVPDARLIAKISDKIVYAVHSGSTPSSTVSAGLRLFDDMNLKQKLAGLVLTQIKKRKGYGYSGYGYGSEYYTN